MTIENQDLNDIISALLLNGAYHIKWIKDDEVKTITLIKGSKEHDVVTKLINDVSDEHRKDVLRVDGGY